MNIYTSEKVVPYVYMGTHRVTGEFYIGSRANKNQTLPSHQDIYKYRTSSKKVKPIFDEFDWIIVAEFFDPQSAYDFEQELIYKLWNNPLIINGSCFYNQPRWSNIGGSISHNTAVVNSNKTRTRTAYANGKKMSPESIQRMVTTNATLWYITSPDGDTYTTLNLAEHCRTYNIDPSAMRRVALGKFTQHKGWKCSYSKTKAG